MVVSLVIGGGGAQSCGTCTHYFSTSATFLGSVSDYDATDQAAILQVAAQLSGLYWNPPDSFVDVTANSQYSSVGVDYIGSARSQGFVTIRTVFHLLEAQARAAYTQMNASYVTRNTDQADIRAAFSSHLPTALANKMVFWQGCDVVTRRDLTTTCCTAPPTPPNPPPPPPIAPQRVGGIRYLMQFGQDEAWHDQRAPDKARFGHIDDATINQGTGINDEFA